MLCNSSDAVTVIYYSVSDTGTARKKTNASTISVSYVFTRLNSRLSHTKFRSWQGNEVFSPGKQFIDLRVSPFVMYIFQNSSLHIYIYFFKVALNPSLHFLNLLPDMLITISDRKISGYFRVDTTYG